MFNDKAILYYRIAIPNNGSLNAGLYVPSIFDSVEEANIKYIKGGFEGLRQKAAVRGLDIVAEVIACEDNDSTARRGWRKAVELALANEADSIVVASPNQIAPSTRPVNAAKNCLDMLGIRVIIAG